MRALLLHNPKSGTANHDEDSMVAALALAGLDVRYANTKDKKDLKKALEEPADLVVIAGGDGTVRKIATQLPDRSIPVAIVPLGNANNVARSLGIAGTPQELAETWRMERAKPFHFGSIDGLDEPRLFVEGFGIGLLADLFLRRAKGDKAQGVSAILRGREALHDVLLDESALDLSLSIDGEPFEGDLIGIEVMNIPFTGPSLPLACDADPCDTLLDVVCVRPEERAAMLAWLDAPLHGPPPVTARRAKRIDLVWRDAASRIDDDVAEPSGERRHVSIACDPDPLRILMPAEDPVHRRDAQGSPA